MKAKRSIIAGLMCLGMIAALVPASYAGTDDAEQAEADEFLQENK